jgi:hypothetical protein
MKLIHQPRLDTIRMVEEAVRTAEEYPNKRQLWLSLPKKIMYQTFCVILDYLDECGKIHIDTDGAILWTYQPELVKKAAGCRRL